MSQVQTRKIESIDEVKTGDRIMAIKDIADTTAGKVYEVIKVYETGGSYSMLETMFGEGKEPKVVFMDDAGDLAFLLLGDFQLVVEPASKRAELD